MLPGLGVIYLQVYRTLHTQYHSTTSIGYGGEKSFFECTKRREELHDNVDNAGCRWRLFW